MGLKNLFSKCGKVKYAKIMQPKTKQALTTFGYVSFSSMHACILPILIVCERNLLKLWNCVFYIFVWTKNHSFIYTGNSSWLLSSFFRFVDYEKHMDAMRALESLNRYEIEGGKYRLRVKVAFTEEERAQRAVRENPVISILIYVSQRKYVVHFFFCSMYVYIKLYFWNLWILLSYRINHV